MHIAVETRLLAGARIPTKILKSISNNIYKPLALVVNQCLQAYYLINMKLANQNQNYDSGLIVAL